FDELQRWWQNTTPEMQAAAQTVSLVLVALLGGHFLGGLVARALRAQNFDAALRLPGTSASMKVDHGITPTLVAGLLVRLTIWAAALCWLAHKYGQGEFASSLGLIVKRAWMLAAVLVASLTLGSLLARRLIDCLENPAK